MERDEEYTSHELPRTWMSIGSQSESFAFLDLLRGEVRVDAGRSISLAPMELRLFVYLAISHKGVGLERLNEDLWPHLDEDNARKVLKVHVHRLRRKTGVFDCILSDQGTYRIGSVALPNLDRIENAIRPLAQSGEPIGESILSDVRRVRLALRRGRPVTLTTSDWFETTERRLHNLEFDVTVALARHELIYGDCDRVLALTRDLIEFDPFDEQTRELRLAAVARCNGIKRARAEYDAYERLIREELHSSPSPRLRLLVYGDGSKS